LSSLLLFFQNTAPPQIYTLSLHDALPIFSTKSLPASGGTPSTRKYGALTRWPSSRSGPPAPTIVGCQTRATASASNERLRARISDRKSTRLNSSHQIISYAVFCLKKKKTK